MKSSLVSIIIRTKNEDDWIGRCLDAIKKQTYQNYEIVIVDTGSTDRTLDILKAYDVNLIIYDEKYIPGKVLNYGCRDAKGKYLVFISAHCLPVNDEWLENLVKGIDDPHIAGIYGKQEPMDETNPFDKRDLILTFGLDRKVQWKDSFFHNANSIIKTELWKMLPFDETLSNIEDRVWAANMQKLGYCIVYEPSSRVFHHHGIHQTGDRDRCHGINEILNNFQHYINDNIVNKKIIKKECIDAIIPFSIELDLDKNIEMCKANLNKIINILKNINQIRDIYFLTDSEVLINYARDNKLNIKIPYVRKNDSIETVLGILEYFIEHAKFNDVSFLIAYMSATNINKDNSYQKLCEEYSSSNNSSAIFVKENKGMFFKKSQGIFYRLDEQLGRYKGYKNPIYEAIESKGFIVHIDNIKDGFLHKQNILILNDNECAILPKINTQQK